ncbi:MAG: hypothetical protein FWD53_09235 [Phycisphaerales bacterium]|nr:hypothetical protein [Phycisphaerales bacterium]
MRREEAFTFDQLGNWANYLTKTSGCKPIRNYQIYKGTVFELVDQAVWFVMSKLTAAVGTRAESNRAPVTYELPRLAVSEAIVNAIAHRDYTSNASVQVMLFADRLEVWNPGELPPSLTPESLRKPHASIPRNPLIAEPLFLTRYIEKAGTGILDMIGLCKEAKLRVPKFRQESGQFIQTLWRPEKAQVEAQDKEDQIELSATEITLLRACRKKTCTGNELLQAAGYAKRTGNFKRGMDRLLDAGLLEMTIPDKPNSRLQKYRLTAKGLLTLSKRL